MPSFQQGGIIIIIDIEAFFTERCKIQVNRRVDGIRK
jgi:hypothetical protein